MKKARTKKIKKIFFISSLFFLLSPTLVSAICCNCHSPSEPSKNICLTGNYDNCKDLQIRNGALADYTCDSTPLTTQCKKIATSDASAICFNTPAEASTYVPSKSKPSELSKTITAPQVEIQIPGLQFQEIIDVTGGLAYEPYLAQYISAIYNYAVGLSVIAAAVAIVYGGFLYIAGSAMASVTRGKELIFNALIGLFLVLGLHTILSTLNPKLVEMSVLGIKIVSREGAFDDPEMERKRVEEAATIKDYGDTTEVEIIDLTPQPPGLSEPEPATTQTGGEETKLGIIPQPAPIPTTPGETPKPPPGTVVKNEKGEYVAQQKCPEDMVKIPHSETYEGKMHVRGLKSFCMDRYEYPNQAGVKPFNGVNDWEADHYCHSIGKRLCWNMEWQRACLGPNADKYFMYGPTYIEGKQITGGHTIEQGDPWFTIAKPDNPPAPCNYDSNNGQNTQSPKAGNQDSIQGVTVISPFKGETSLLNENNPLFTSDEIARGVLGTKKFNNKTLTWKEAYQYLKIFLKDMSPGAEPSGTRPTCVSAEGVYDLTANLQEIALTNLGMNSTYEQRIAAGMVKGSAKPYAWVGFYWAPIAHFANTKAKPDCFNLNWGGVHEAGSRSYENGFRCCMDFEE